MRRIAPMALGDLVLHVSSGPSSHAAYTGAMSGLKACFTHFTHWPMRTLARNGGRIDLMAPCRCTESAFTCEQSTQRQRHPWPSGSDPLPSGPWA